MKQRPWLLFTLITTVFWGVWGAFIEIPEKAGFPATLGYSVWALTMIPCAIAGLIISKWKLDFDRKSVLYGAAIGLSGAGGQLILFQALREGPAYVVFPVVSLSPVVTIFMSVTFLKESTTRKHWTGIVLALIGILLLSYMQPATKTSGSYIWLLLAILVFLLWGIQAYFIKLSNETMRAESIFFYMMVTAVLLIPVAFYMTDFNQQINWGFRGPWLAAMIQILNAIGALTLVYAFRYGKAIIVAPATALAPVITIIFSLFIYGVFPHPITLAGLCVAVIAIYLMAE